jgi:hypothetical protein
MLSKDPVKRPASYKGLISELEGIRKRIEDTHHIAAVPSLEADRSAGLAAQLQRALQASSLLRSVPPRQLLLVVALVLAVFVIAFLIGALTN